MSAESALGVGSRFHFELTFDLIDDNSISSYDDDIDEDMEMPNFTGEVLVFEDNKLNQQVICDHLDRVGLTSIVAHNGKEGVDILEERIGNGEKPFDIIFMDIHMPVMDGLDAASRITRMGINTPIIALTANVMSNDLELYKANGMVDCVGKPFTSRELWKCLMKYLTADSFTEVSKSEQALREEKTQHKLKINFIKSNQDTLEIFTHSLKSGEIVVAHRIAHTLKSVAGQLGEKKLQTAAAEAERMLSDGENRMTASQLMEFEDALNSLLEKLSPLLSEKKENITLLNDDDTVREVIEELEPLLKSKSTKCVALLDKIRAIPGSEELASHIESYNFKPAYTALENLKKDIGIE